MDFSGPAETDPESQKEQLERRQGAYDKVPGKARGVRCGS